MKLHKFIYTAQKITEVIKKLKAKFAKVMDDIKNIHMPKVMDDIENIHMPKAMDDTEMHKTENETQ